LATLGVGVVASLALLGWIGWWALTTSLATPAFPLPGLIALMIVVLWLAGCLTVIRHPWRASVLFLAPGALIASAWGVVPQPELLLACSAGLAVWALLGGITGTGWRQVRWVNATGQRWSDALSRWLRATSAAAPRPETYDLGRAPRCLICHVAEAGPDGFCVECGRWVRLLPGEWADARSRPPRRGHPPTCSAPADPQPATDMASRSPRIQTGLGTNQTSDMEGVAQP
jgi:hypothetical protein